MSSCLCYDVRCYVEIELEVSSRNRWKCQSARTNDRRNTFFSLSSIFLLVIQLLLNFH
uniref:Uncharacterized protein n=1 Tax=Arundo donax TaxID=35708 RepID=A0A0A9D427_ARUDO